VQILLQLCGIAEEVPLETAGQPKERLDILYVQVFRWTCKVVLATFKQQSKVQIMVQFAKFLFGSF
jgi:hypothetical protein